MRTRGLIATYLLGLALPFLESVWPRIELARGAFSAPLWLVAFALLTCPRRAAAEEAAWRVSARLLCALTPPLGLALGLDLARGAEARSAWLVTAGFAVLFAGWSLLGEHAAQSARRRARYGDAWLVLVPGAAALAMALFFAPSRSVGAGVPAFWSLSPLVLAQRAALPGGFGARPPLEFAWALAGGLAAAAFVLSAAREERS